VKSGFSLYLAGPMTGLPRWNFDAFAEACVKLRAAGWCVWCPAEQDEMLGFDPDTPPPLPPDFLEDALLRNALAMTQVHGVAVLGTTDQKSRSKGLAVELAIARYLDLPVLPANEWLASKQKGGL